MELREKVINGLECCTQPSIECNSNCPYAKAKRNVWMACYDVLMDDALALLKAQEPNEDWISRERLKNEIQYYIDEAGWGEEANKVLGWCLEFIDNQKAVKRDDN